MVKGVGAMNLNPRVVSFPISCVGCYVIYRGINLNRSDFMAGSALAAGGFVICLMSGPVGAFLCKVLGKKPGKPLDDFQ